MSHPDYYTAPSIKSSLNTELMLTLNSLPHHGFYASPIINNRQGESLRASDLVLVNVSVDSPVVLSTDEGYCGRRITPNSHDLPNNFKTLQIAAYNSSSRSGQALAVLEAIEEGILLSVAKGNIKGIQCLQDIGIRGQTEWSVDQHDFQIAPIGNVILKPGTTTIIMISGIPFYVAVSKEGGMVVMKQINDLPKDADLVEVLGNADSQLSFALRDFN
jgi:hypothetical protein